MDESKFQMWRAIINIIHADNHISPEEEKFVLERVERMRFTPDQKEKLIREMDSDTDMSEIYPLISNPADRAQIVHFARVLSHIDGNYEPDEKQLIETLHLKAMEKVDMNEVRGIMASIRTQFEKEKTPNSFREYITSFFID